MPSLRGPSGTTSSRAKSDGRTGKRRPQRLGEDRAGDPPGVMLELDHLAISLSSGTGTARSSAGAFSTWFAWARPAKASAIAPR